MASAPQATSNGKNSEVCNNRDFLRYGYTPKLVVGDDKCVKVLMGDDDVMEIRLPGEEKSRQEEPSLAGADFLLPRLSLEHPNDKMRAETEGGLEEGTPSVGYYGYVRRTLEQMEAEFGENQNVWERSEAIVSLRAQMSLIETKDKIDIIVCLGLGSLQNSISSSRRTSHRQVAAILTIFDYLKAFNSVHCIAQDPAYSDLDREFLHSLDIEVVDDPEGFLQVDQKTLVYGVGGYTFFYDIISRGPWPAAFISNGFEWAFSGKDHSTYSWTEGEVQRMKEMISGCKQQPFPQLDGSDAFEDVILYWRDS